MLEEEDCPGTHPTFFIVILEGLGEHKLYINATHVLMMVEEYFQSHFLWKGKYLEEMMLKIVQHVQSNTLKVRNVYRSLKCHVYDVCLI